MRNCFARVRVAEGGVHRTTRAGLAVGGLGWSERRVAEVHGW